MTARPGAPGGVSASGYDATPGRPNRTEIKIAFATALPPGIHKDGKPTVDAAYTWSFNIQEMKRALIEIVTNAGWDWRPVVTFVRLING